MNISKIKWTGFYVGLSMIIYCCEYQTDETFYRNVNKNVALPDLVVNLNLTSDTIYVYNNPNVKLALKLTNKTLYAVNFYVNNILVEGVEHQNDENYSFYIDISKQDVIKVRAEIYTSTETGSIAEKVLMESFVFKTKEWVLIYIPEKPVLKTEISDGRLKLSWTPIKSYLTGKYYITDYIFTDSTVNTWYIDSSYTGGQKQFSVHFDDNGISGYFAFTDINYSYPKVYVHNRDSFWICWDKCKFYNNIDGYRVRIDDSVYIFKPSDTSFIYKKGVLGRTIFGNLDLLLKDYFKNNSAFYWCATFMGNYQLSFLPDYSFFEDSYFPLSGTSFYYWTYVENNKTIYSFSTETKSKIDSALIWADQFSVSPNNKFLLCVESDQIKLLNTNGFEVLKDLSRLNVFNTLVNYSLNISDVGTSVFYDYSKDGLVVYDFINESIITEIPLSDYVYQYKMSADGKYIFEPKLNAFYKVENNSNSKIWGQEDQSYQYSFFEFFPDNPNQIALYDGELMYIKKCSDFSTITSFPLNNRDIVNIDFDQNKILAFGNLMFYVFSLTTGNLLYSIPTHTTINSRLFNDYIFSNNSQFDLNRH